MIVNPIIPIWLMVIICIPMLIIKRKGVIPYIRQVLIIVLLFIINLRIMVSSGEVINTDTKLNVYTLFVIDDTISMIARDYNGDTERLTAVKADCQYMVDSLYGAHFGVISFNNNAYLASPFTDNSSYIKDVINGVNPIDELYAKGSSMNISKELMIENLKTINEKENCTVVLIYISDGEITNNDTLDSFKEAAQYVDYGAVLGYGSEAGGKMYMLNYDDKLEAIKDPESYDDAISVIDENNLKRIAKDIDIPYIHMDKQANINSVLDDIKNNADVIEKDDKITGYKDIYYYFVIILGIMLIVECILYKKESVKI